ncbi:putative MutS protein [Fusarium oxysporum f. sp. albedinis]|nr:putative MutS protein [Fusarium oxysporum f. sp. albedinis]
MSAKPRIFKCEMPCDGNYERQRPCLTRLPIIYNPLPLAPSQGNLMPADHLENAIAQLRAEVLSDPDATNDPVEAVDDQNHSYLFHKQWKPPFLI